MDNRKLNLLALKQAAGLATDGEVAALGSAYHVIGGGLAVPFAAVDAEAWERRYAAVRYDALADDAGADADEAPAVTTPAVSRTPDGLLLCAPDREPAHPSKPRTHRPHGIGRE